MTESEFKLHRPSDWNGHPIPYGASVEELTNLLQRPAPVCWTAFIALASTPGEAALALLHDYAGSKDPHFRYSAIEAIGNHPEGWRLSDDIQKLLLDTHDFVVCSAIMAAAKHHLVDLHDIIFKFLNHEDESTRSTAVHALRVLWQPTDFDRVFQVHTKDPSIEVRKKAGWTLRTCVTDTTWRSLFGIWWNDPIPRHRQWACDLAAAYGDEGVISVVHRLRDDNDGHVRYRAADAVREIRHRILSTN